MSAPDLIPAELWNRLGVALPPEGAEHEESCPVSFAGGGQCRCYRAPLVAAVRAVIAGLIFTDYRPPAPAPANAPDPVPAELAARIVRAHKAVNEAAGEKDRDYPVYMQTLATARRDLADAYEAALRHASADTTLFYSLLDAYSGLRAHAEDDDHKAREDERWRAQSGGQA